ncbi:S4 domain-containing protein, partial [Paenibacillus glucanolyticus]
MSTKGRTTQRLDKVLSNLGFGSRAELKKMAKQGSIVVNGTVMKDPGKHVDPYTDIIEFEGETIQYREYVYIMLHKP